jgi:hypothetical protein
MAPDQLFFNLLNLWILNFYVLWLHLQPLFSTNVAAYLFNNLDAFICFINNKTVYFINGSYLMVTYIIIICCTYLKKKILMDSLVLVCDGHWVCVFVVAFCDF